MCKRKENESFEDFKNRRKTENLTVKVMSRGTLIWDSKKQGQYMLKNSLGDTK